MNAVQFDGVTLRLGSREVLTNVSFAVEEGEFVGILGPNGSGKTTLLRAVLGLIAPIAGCIQVFGGPPARGNPDAGYMPQANRSVADLPLSGRDFVLSAVGAGRWGLAYAGKAARRDAAQALEVVGAEALAKRPLSELSGGERQRLLIAQTLIGKPRLLLLDEPLLSLDPSRQSSIVELVRRLRDDFGVTVLFSAHEINPLIEVLDKVLYLGNGQAAIGTVDEVITGPILSRLYGTEIEVIRAFGRIFVMSRLHDMEHAEHRHDV